MAMGIFQFIVIVVPLGMVLITLFLIQRYLQVKGLKTVFVMYIIILLISTIVVHIVPKNNFVTLSQLKMNATEPADYNTFYNAINAGALSDHKEFIIKKEWDYSIDDNELEIVYDEQSLPIFIERKETKDNRIKVIHYSSKISFGSTDLSEKKYPFRIFFNQNKLRIENPLQFNYDISGFKKDFVVSQFSEESSLFSGDYFVAMHTRSFDALVILIPKDVQLTPNSKYLLVDR